MTMLYDIPFPEDTADPDSLLYVLVTDYVRGDIEEQDEDWLLDARVIEYTLLALQNLRRDIERQISENDSTTREHSGEDDFAERRRDFHKWRRRAVHMKHRIEEKQGIVKQHMRELDMLPKTLADLREAISKCQSLDEWMRIELFERLQELLEQRDAMEEAKRDQEVHP